MLDVKISIPEITDEDVDWVCQLMGLGTLDRPRCEFLKSRSTVDVSACPGSGKTTLVVAKLAILAQKWSYRTRGICVLSHTNVARQEIEQRLGGTYVGRRLLAYPHFVDTIHGFANKFLAVPWLHSNGFRVNVIDNDVTAAYRRGVIGRKDFYKIDGFLQKKNNTFDNLRICARDFSFDLSGKPFPASSSTTVFGLAAKAINASAKAGFFCHEEMFVWARALLQDHPELATCLMKRFPIVIIDEMQDTSNSQCAILSSVFPRNSEEIIVQRIGDPNQALFDVDNDQVNQTDPFPDEDHCLDIPNSFRFGSDIAAFASPFAVRAVPPSGLCGTGPKRNIPCCQPPVPHSIFLFPDNDTSGVLESYGQHLLDVFPDGSLENGLVTAVGAVHQDAPHIGPGHSQYPKTVSHYWAGYSRDISHKDSNPKILVKYILMGQTIAREKGELRHGLEKIASGFIRLADISGDIGTIKGRASAHRAVLDRVRGNPAILQCYQLLIKLLLIERIPLSSTNWEGLRNEIVRVAGSLCTGGANFEKAKDFLDWPDDPTLNTGLLKTPTEPLPNVYRVAFENRKVDIKLGSIHSVKGQTHLATLILNTFWYAHDFRQMLPWLLGNRANGNQAGARDISRLIKTYVAMTRPTKLLCLAMPRSALGTDLNNAIHTLQRQGWKIAEIADGVTQWRD